MFFFRCLVRYIPSVHLCSCQVLIVVCLSSCQAFKESEIFIARARLIAAAKDERKRTY